MAKSKFELNRAGVRELLKSGDMDACIKGFAEGVYNRVNHISGYTLEKRNYPERIGYAICATEHPAISDNLKNNSLLKAVGK